MQKKQFIQFIKNLDGTILLNMSKNEILDKLGGNFARMQRYPQNNPHHCYDLLEHTARTIGELDCDGLTETETLELKIAALYHDIGKPVVAFEKNGHTVFYNHAQESRKIAEEELASLGFDGDTLNRILFYIAHHDNFISFKSKTEVKQGNTSFVKPITLKTVYQRILTTCDEHRKNAGFVPSVKDYATMLRLCVADVKAQSPKVIQDGILIDSMERKLNRLEEIAKIMKMISNADAERCDFHVHSTYSDGTDTPEQLVKKAAQEGLRAIALTDHNTIDGLDEFIESAKQFHIDAVPGIEFSTEYENRELHVVALFVEKRYYQKIREYLSKAQDAKKKSNRLLIMNLQNAGYEVDYNEIEKFSANGNVNRAVIAQYLVEKGIISTVKEGFETILSKKYGYYIPPRRLATLDTIKFIKSIGAIAVLAHPLLEFSEEELAKFIPIAKAAGLDSVEAFYSLFSEEQQEAVLRLAAQNKLLLSGGSDYHGTVKPQIDLGVGCGNLKISLENYLLMIKFLSTR